MTTPAPLQPATPVIGVFDSGLGGLTVLGALRRRLPAARLLYAADSAYAPYGERDAAYVQQRSLLLASFLHAQGAQLLVVACNTATALAIAELRARWPALPFVGIEPAIKPALAARRDGEGPVGVLATPATLGSDRFRALLRQQGDDPAVLLQPCPGLAEAVEALGPQHPRTLNLVHTYCAPLRRAGCTRVVLGCTHYPLLAQAIRDALGGAGVELLDPADAVAAQAQRLAQGLAPPGAEDPRDTQPQGALQAWSNGDPQLLRRVAAACGIALEEVAPLAQPQLAAPCHTPAV